VPSYKSKTVGDALEKKGFRRTNSADRMYHLYVDGRRTSVRTKLSHGPDKTLGDALVAQMRKQTRLDRSEFDEFVRCPMSHEDYVALLRERGGVR